MLLTHVPPGRRAVPTPLLVVPDGAGIRLKYGLVGRLSLLGSRIRRGAEGWAVILVS